MPNRRAAVITGSLGAAAVLACSVLALTGFGIWWLVATSVALSALAVAARRGPAMGIATAVIAVACLLLASMLVSAAIHVPMFAVVVAVVASVGLSASFVVARTPGGIRWPTRSQAWQWLPALTGSIVWLATVALCRVIPGAARLSWVTTGDSANYVMNARTVTSANGIGVYPGSNPVPFPSALVALSDGAGWIPVPPQDVIAHELNSLSSAWTVSIALLCLLAGVLAASTLGSSRPRVAAVVGAGVSLLPLSWLIGTYSVEYGFFNAPVALALLLASVLAAFNGKRTPALALALLLLSAVAILATWTPLVVIPGALAFHIAIENRRELWRSALWAKALLAVPVAGAIAFALFVSLSGYLANPTALVAEGGYFPLSPLLPAAVFLLGAAVMLVGRRVGLARPAALMITIIASSAIGVNLLLARTGFTLSYYPQKFLWLAVSVVFIVGVILAAAIISRVAKRRMQTLVALGLLAAVTSGALLVVPTSKPGYDGRDLVSSMLTSHFAFTSEPIAQRIIANTDPSRPVFLWPTASIREFGPNLWLLITYTSPQAAGPNLRDFAYDLQTRNTVRDLCELATAFDTELTVETTYRLLESDLAVACPDEAASISVVVVP